MQLLRRRVRAEQPLLLVEADGVHDQRIAFPVPDGVSQIRRAQFVLRWVLPSVGVDHSPRMRARDIQQEHALQIRCIDDLKARRVEEAGPAPGFAVDQRRIQSCGRRPVGRQRPSPRQHRNIRSARETAAASGTHFPVALVLFGRAKIHAPIGPVRRRPGIDLRRCGLRRASQLLPGARLSQRDQSTRQQAQQQSHALPHHHSLPAGKD